MIKPIPLGLQREHVLRALAELDAGAGQTFGEPTRWLLHHEGKVYPPKAAIGLAFRHFTGQILSHRDFSSGEGGRQAVGYLRKLGFTVERMDDTDATGSDWTRQEVQLLVADYFAMLQAELLGRSYSKSQHRAALKPLLRGRSDGSIEFKHQNLSAVLAGLTMPYIAGYKPRGNFQALLAEVVQEHLASQPSITVTFEQSPVLNPVIAPSLALVGADVFDEPPDEMPRPRAQGKPWLSRRGKKLDFALRDAQNRQLGKLGEQFVVEVEKKRLVDAKRRDLANKVEWIADTCGDGVGFDILSFSEEDELERFVEVKTTGLGKFFPFYVTANEVACSEDVPDKYHLYRVFDFSRRARVYVLAGSLGEGLDLQPVVYRATV